MSKNVKILENGVENVLQDVVKIQTQLTNGSRCNWVPYDEYPLGVLTVTQDGVYKASEDINGPYYGYSQVVASGVGNIVMGSLGELTVTENGTYEAEGDISGPYLGYSKVVVNVPIDDSYHTSSGTIGKDDQGNDVIATVNPDTGEIEVHDLDDWIPTRIEVTDQPLKFVYNDGETIDMSGALITAYTEDDEVWGKVSLEEITIDPTVAVYENTQNLASLDDTSSLRNPDLPQPVSYEAVLTVIEETPEAYWPSTKYVIEEFEDVVYASGLYCSEAGGSYHLGIVFVSKKRFRIRYYQYNDRSEDHHWTERGTISPSSYYYGDDVVYYCDGLFDEDAVNKTIPFPYITYATSGNRIPIETDMAYIILYGIHSEGHTYDGKIKKSITVSWPRPNDGQVLQTTFEILVAPASSGSDDS